jgi:putative peptidoglycan lipid II flippase
MGEKHRIAKAASLMSGATLISRVLGYMRDMVIAFYFGATGLSDTFFVAFRIPNLLRELFAEGSMSSAVIPVLTEYREKGESEAVRLVRATLAFLLVVVGAICVLGIIFAPEIVTVLAPGFLRTPEKFSSTVLLTRVMFPFLLFISLAALLMGALNTRRVFFIPALAPAVLNVTIITTVFLLATSLEAPILAVAVGVALGGFMQLAFQCPSFIGQGYSIKPALDFRNPGLIKILRLVLPVTLGMAVAQINIVVSNILASYLPEGSITYLFYSMRLIHFPIGVFGVAMGMAVLPSLSSHALKKDFDKLREDFSFALRLLFFISVPAMAGLIALRVPIVNLLFQHGKWDCLATEGTARALLFYSTGIWAVVGVRVLAATFYSMQDTATPVKAAVAALLANIVLSLALMGPMSYSGLALANALSSMLNFTLLFHFLRKKLGRTDTKNILRSFAKVSLASAVMATAGGLLLRGDLWSGTGESLLKAGYLAGTIALLIAIYSIICRLLGTEELDFTLNMLKEKFRKGRSHDN